MGLRHRFLIFGLPFVLIGLGMMAAPFYAYRKAQRTLYAITSERALIISGGIRREVKSFPLGQLKGEASKSQRSDGWELSIFHSTTELTATATM